MKILTGNDLKSGDVLWWTGEYWSRHVEEAKDVGDDVAVILATEQAAQRVNAAYAIDATTGPNGPVPAHIKDRIRARGPSVRADLAVPPADPHAGNWVI